MTNPFRWPLSISAVWMILPVAGAVIAATIEPIPPHDYWWHLAMGRLIAATGAVPDANLFLYTLPVDEPFVDQPWLGQLLLWWFYDAFGHAGTIVLRNVLLVAAYALLLATALQRSDDARGAGGLGVLSVILAYPVLTVRTRMFAFLPFAAVLWAAIGVADGRLKKRWLALPPLATIFWANTHGSFVLATAIVLGVGAGVVAGRMLDDRRVPWTEVRDWGLAGAAVIIAGAIGPHGFAVYGYVFQLAVESSVAASVSEWLPPDPSEATGMVFLGAVVASIGLLAMRRRQVRLYEAFLYAGMLYLSAGAIRSMFWWAAVLPVVVAPHLAAILPASEESEDPGGFQLVLNVGAVAAFLFAALLVQPGLGREAVGEASASGLARHDGAGAWVLNHENAEAAISRIVRDRRRRIFHDQSLGGMLEFHLSGEQPAAVAFVDQRMEFVPDEVWDSYFATSRADEGWAEELDRWEVDTLLLSPESQWPLLQAALATPEWEVVATDASHVLLYRSLDGGENPPE